VLSVDLSTEAIHPCERTPDCFVAPLLAMTDGWLGCRLLISNTLLANRARANYSYDRESAEKKHIDMSSPPS